MPTYTVREIRSARNWPSDEDTKVVYYDFLVDGEDRLVNVGRKPGNPLTVGTVLEGTMEAGDRGALKFKKAQNGFGGGPRPRDPQEGARIIRQHSQEMALLYAALRAEKELLPDPFTLADLKKVIDWFEADAKAATP